MTAEESAAIYKPPAGSKRTASWKSPRPTSVSVPLCPTLGIKQPFPQPALPSSISEEPLAGQSSSKRQRISHQEASTPTQQPFSTSTKNVFWMTWNNWHKWKFEEADERDLEHLEATMPRDTQEKMIRPVASTQRNTSIIGDHLDATIREDAGLQQRLQDCSSGMSNFNSRKYYMLYTKAAVLSTMGIVELGVKIDGSSVHNLLPRSIASRLRLPLHFGDSILANNIIPTNQYCRFHIRVASVETTIDACVVSELPSVLLGREWIGQINLLSDFGNHKYYIPGPYGYLIQILDLGTAITTETETSESTTAKEVGTREQMTAVDKVPATVHEDRSNEEYPLGESAEVNECDKSDTTSETIDNDEIWAGESLKRCE